MTIIDRRRALISAGSALLLAGAPGRLLAAEGGSDALRLVDPELRAPFLLNPSIVTAANLVATRARMMSAIPPFLPRPEVIVRTIPGPANAPDVRISIVNARRGTARPALLYLHGGGFVAGSAAGEMAMAQRIALDHDCVAVSVDYRLAPETRFPGPMEDNYAALLWLYRHAAELGVDVGRIALMGCSGGGGHAAILAAAATDRGEVPIRFQLLLSPMLDDRTGSSRAVPAAIGTFIWTAASNRFGWSSLLGVPAGRRRVPDGAVPSRRSDLRGLPPTYIGVGAIDLFVEENIAYAMRLMAAGVPVELDVVPGAYHIFFAIKPDASVSKRFIASYNDALARAFMPS